MLALDLSLDEGETLQQAGAFQLPEGFSPSGLFAHADGTLYVVSISGAGVAGADRNLLGG